MQKMLFAGLLLVILADASAQSLPSLADPKLSQWLNMIAGDIENIYGQRARIFALPQGTMEAPCPMTPQEITDAFGTRHPSAPMSQTEIESEKFMAKTYRSLGVKPAKLVNEAYTPYFPKAACKDGKLDGPFVGMLSYRQGAEGLPQRNQITEKIEATMRDGKPTGLVKRLNLSVFGVIPDSVTFTVFNAEDERTSVGLSRTEGKGGRSLHVVVSQALEGDRRKMVSVYLNGELFSEQRFKGGFPHGKTFRPKGGFLSAKDTTECYIEGEKVLDPECRVD